MSERTTQRGGAATLVLLACFAIGLGVRHVRVRHSQIQLGYELSSATEELRAEAEEYRRLRLERSLLRNPARIERLATGMGMSRPDPARIRLVPLPPAQPPVAAAGEGVAAPAGEAMP